jgi:hypothetical protein
MRALDLGEAAQQGGVVVKKHATSKKRSPKMKTIDATKKHAVTLTFLLEEKISPQELAQKIAKECAGNVLQDGDAIRVDHAKIACVITDETLSLPHWRSSVREPKRPKLTPNRCK